MSKSLKVVFLFLFLSLLIIRPTPALAWHGHDGWRGRGFVDVNFGVWPGPYYGYPYNYAYADPYYYPGYAVVASPTYQPVVVNGVTYYVNNGVYYTYTQYGYQAVATPAGVTVPAIQAAGPATPLANVGAADSYTINIPNNKGGYNAVLLKKSGNGFTGPQGEFYSEFPKVSQLQVMYGK